MGILLLYRRKIKFKILVFKEDLDLLTVKIVSCIKEAAGRTIGLQNLSCVKGVALNKKPTNKRKALKKVLP